MSKVKKDDSTIGQITEKILQRTMIKLKIKTTPLLFSKQYFYRNE